MVIDNELLQLVLTEVQEYLHLHYKEKRYRKPMLATVARAEADKLECFCNEEVLAELPCDAAAIPAKPKSKKADNVCYSLNMHKELQDLPGLNELLHMKELTFVDYLNKLMLAKELDAPTVYKRSNLDKRLFNKFSNRTYAPSKKTVLALVIGMQLNMQEAKTMLNYAGFSLSPSNRTDVIVSYFLEQSTWKKDIDLVNSVLLASGEKTLGSKYE